METDFLKLLRLDARHLFDPTTFGPETAEAARSFELPLGRHVPLEPAAIVIEEAMRRGPREASDAWLAPRLHASLRLYRSEAADPRVWLYLTARFAEFMIWRWGSEDDLVSQYALSTKTRDNGLARLWWAAELTRNGDDYSATEAAFSHQELILHLLDRNAFQNRPAALAFVRFTGPDATDREIRLAANALNHILTTRALDVIAPDVGPDMQAIEEWVQTAPDPTLMLGDSLPQGPFDARVLEDTILAVEDLLRSAVPDLETSISRRRAKSRGAIAQENPGAADSAVAVD
jgi:hypothetical protein